MSWVQELFDVIGRFNFVETVYEYQLGLYFRAGIAQEKRVRWHGEDLEAIVTGEDAVREDLGVKRFVPFYHPVLPVGYRRSKVHGRIRSQVRDYADKNLQAGIYFYLPFIDTVLVESQQERVISLGTMTLETNDENKEPMLVSPNVRYQLKDLYRACCAVHDYEASMKDHVLSLLAKHGRTLSLQDWRRAEKVECVQEKVLAEMRELGEEWGLDIKKVYIVDSGLCSIQKLIPKTPLVTSVVQVPR